jgi:hypothetical protein
MLVAPTFLLKMFVVLIKPEVEMRKSILSVIAGALLLSFVSAGYAEEPMQNVNPRRHPDIAAAQKLSRQAYDKISRAQSANRYDMEGHAQKAKVLLDQVNDELKLAAQAANRNGRR